MAGTSHDLVDLLARTALRDRAAFRVLYARTSAKLFGVALRILRDRAEAEEALQEVYVKVWQRADRFRDGGGSPISWLVAVTRNHCLDLMRTRRPGAEGIELALEVPDAAPDPEAEAASAGERALIDACLDELEAERAAAVRGAYLEGYSYIELAERHNVPLNTMRTWLRRSLMRLRDCLTR